jgi:hypothetical protein
VTLDFTLEKYAQFCETIQRLDCPVMTVKDFLVAGQPGGSVIVLRHDVDRRMNAALRMAELESTYGISATYYVRMIPTVFKPEALRRLHGLGHEVGYHYEVLAKAKGETETAIALFEQELKQFREIVPVETASMHGSPLSPWNNLDLWQTHHVTDYDLVGEVYLTVDYVRMYYFTDTGRSWDAGQYNLRDRVDSLRPTCEVESTDDLIDFFVNQCDRPALINTHPNRWATNQIAWGLGLILDGLINQAKVIIRRYRHTTM